jgi:lipopolysaccharide export system protein LptA
MRRTSIFLAFAAIFISAVVGYTYWLRLKITNKHVTAPTPKVKQGLEGVAKQGWHYQQDDPQANRPVVIVDAKGYEATKDPSTFLITGLVLRLYNKKAASYTLVKSDSALLDEGTGLLRSEAPVTIVMNVASDKSPDDKAEIDKHVRVETTGVLYETKTGKASTDKLATFTFPAGGGQAMGVEYDPNLRVLHMKSQIALDWKGDGPPENKMHVEAGDLVYKELEQKIYLTPWSKMSRQTMVINAGNSVVLLDDGRLHQIDSVKPVGMDDRNGRRVDYTADNMTALFNDDGALTEVIGDKHARVTSTQEGARTVLTGDRADLRFAVDVKQEAGKETSESSLQTVTAEGHAEADSQPLPMPGVLLGDTRILRSEHIQMQMKPGGQEVQEISSPTVAKLEFKPNRAGQPHRFLDASRLRVIYGESSYVDTFLAWNVQTRTDKPPQKKDEKVEPAYTWSDEMTAKFKPGSNSIATIDQRGHFRYSEGARKANSDRAFLEQDANRITLNDKARVLDDNGSTNASQIVMNQATGDMDATGGVRSTHAADKNQKPGTSMLDASEPMQAQADKMLTSDSNTKVTYEGHAVLWQGANRISANSIFIDRDAQTLEAKGNVVSELVDKRGSGDTASPTAPIFTTVRAPNLVYHDDTRIALYTGGVTLVRDRMTVTAGQMRAFLNPKTGSNSNDSSLDHAFSDGDVKIAEKLADGRTRVGTSEHCEYYTKDDKVILNGGAPQLVDSMKGIAKGRQLTYFSDEDRLIVEGEEKKVAFTKMKKR